MPDPSATDPAGPAPAGPAPAGSHPSSRRRPPARWSLPDQPSLERLRKQAKQLRRAAAAGDSNARELIAAYDPGPGDVPLARAQRVLARAYGFSGWSHLRSHLDVLAAWTREMDDVDADDDPVDAFLRLACLSYTAPYAADDARVRLQGDPSLADSTPGTMAACGRAEQLAELLDRDPRAVSRETGPHRWPPLLYLCYSRLDLGDPIATLRALLDAGADPDSGFLWHGLPSPFTALTGVLGGGERDEPPHRQAVTMATMLLDAGADPNDNQAFYNRQFRPDDSHLAPLLGHGAGRPHPSPWRDRLGAAYPSPTQMVGEHLRSAAEKGFTARVETLLAHRVDPNTRGYHPILGDATAYEIAVRNGHTAAASLLAEAGGRSDRIEDIDRVIGAALAGEPAIGAAPVGEPIPAELPDSPAGLVARRPDAMRLAGEQHDVAALGRLLDLGYDVDAAGPNGRTALHEAALRGGGEMVRWLIDHGADPARKECDFGATAAGWAAHAGHRDLAAWLDRLAGERRV